MIDNYRHVHEFGIGCPNVDPETNFITNTDGKGKTEGKDVYLCELDVKENIYLTNGQLLIYSCNFDNIQSSTYAIIYLTSSIQSTKYNVIENCRFRYCSAPKGAIQVYSHSVFQNVSIKNCLFEHNECTESYQSGSLTYDLVYGVIQDCTFINTTATYGHIMISNDLNTIPNEVIEIRGNYFSIEPNSKSKSMIDITSKHRLLMTNNRFNITHAPSKGFHAVICSRLTKTINITSNCVFPYNESKVFKYARVEEGATINLAEAFESGCANEITPTHAFSNSEKFSETNGFSNSEKFSQTNRFSDSRKFTKTRRFSSSCFFSATYNFSLSRKFSDSEHFTKIFFFSNSDDFSKSNKFSFSNKFSDSRKFSSLFHDIPTDELTKSNSNSNLLEFSNSNEFSTNELIIQTSLTNKDFSNFDEFTNFKHLSMKFSNSYFFTNFEEFSQLVSSSNFYSNNDFFTFLTKSHFYNTNDFIYSSFFSKSFTSLLTLTKFHSNTRSIFYKKSYDFTISNHYTESEIIIQRIFNDPKKKSPIIIIVIPILIIVFILIALLTFYIVFKKKKKEKEHSKSETNKSKEQSTIIGKEFTIPSNNSDDSDLNFWL